MCVSYRRYASDQFLFLKSFRSGHRSSLCPFRAHTDRKEDICLRDEVEGFFENPIYLASLVAFALLASCDSGGHSLHDIGRGFTYEEICAELDE